MGFNVAFIVIAIAIVVTMLRAVLALKAMQDDVQYLASTVVVLSERTNALQRELEYLQSELEYTQSELSAFESEVKEFMASAAMQDMQNEYPVAISNLSYVQETPVGHTFTATELEYATRMLIAEAGNQPYEGMCAVAQCFVDRMDYTDCDNLIELLSEPGQFTTPYAGDIAGFPKCFEAIEAVLLHGYRVFDEDVLCFYNPVCSVPSCVAWLETKPYIGTIGDHVFRGEY